MTRVAFFLCGVALLVGSARAGAQDPTITRTPIRSFEELAALFKNAEGAIAEAKKGREHFDRGEFEPARVCFEKALELLRKQFPDDNIVVGQCHGMLSAYYWAVGDPAAALPHARKHLSSADNLPLGVKLPLHEQNRALAANNLGTVLEELGEFAEAEKLYREVLALRGELYPKQDHFDLITSLGNLASVLAARGELVEAEKYAEEAFAMAGRMAKKKENGTSVDAGAFARALNNLAEVRRMRGHENEAATIQAEAIRFREMAYPNGHPDLAMNIRNLAITNIDRGQWEAGADGLEKALAMLQKFYPADRYPQGHPRLCQVMRDLGGMRAALGDYAAAERHLRESLRMADTLFPRSKFPDGHPTRAACLSYLGTYGVRRPETRDEAIRCYREALAIGSRFAAAQSGSLSEIEVLNLIRAVPANLNGLLSATAAGPFDPRDYQYVWASKAAVMRLAERRRRALLSSADPEAARLARELDAVRAELSVKLLSPARPDVTRIAAKKEELERAIADRLRLSATSDDRAHPFDLAAALPTDTAFVDLIGYLRIEQDPRDRGPNGFKAIPHYTAFVIARGQRPVRVELGPARPIHDAIETWRTAIVTPGANERAAARDVGRLVWKPIADRLPAAIASVYVAPDYALNRVPFAALPGHGADRVLLEDMAVAVVPHGPFLLERLKSPARAGKGRILVVGDVDYGPLPPADPMMAPGAPVIAWQPLPKGSEEAKLVADLARSTGKADPDELTGARADPTAVRARLPNSRFAHLATHGYFADDTFLSALGVDADSFRFGLREGGTAARNPLALSGLALAGANRVGRGAPADRGLLTAEGIAGLRLSDMELAVLSACDTGLGTEVSGEGVFGLQRAFHLAGCRTVVASLWKVNDAATRRLMETFYQQLWSGGPEVTPAKALRAAQLGLYRKALAGEDLDRAPLVVPGKGPAPAPPLPAPAGGRQNAGTRYWAAFVTSGGP